MKYVGYRRGGHHERVPGRQSRRGPAPRGGGVQPVRQPRRPRAEDARAPRHVPDRAAPPPERDRLRGVSAVVSTVVLDCTEPAALAEFWSNVLDLPVVTK